MGCTPSKQVDASREDSNGSTHGRCTLQFDAFLTYPVSVSRFCPHSFATHDMVVRSPVYLKGRHSTRGLHCIHRATLFVNELFTLAFTLANQNSLASSTVSRR